MNDIRINRAYANLRAAGMSETAIYRTTRDILPKGQYLTYSQMRRVWKYYGVSYRSILGRKDYYINEYGVLTKGRSTYLEARAAGIQLGTKKDADERYVLGHLMRQNVQIEEFRPEYQERFPSKILPSGDFVHEGY